MQTNQVYRNPKITWSKQGIQPFLQASELKEEDKSLFFMNPSDTKNKKSSQKFVEMKME